MLERRRQIQNLPAGGWLTTAVGLGAGVLAAGLLSATTPLRAVLLVTAVAAGFFCLALPALGVYLLTGLMIAQWPGEIIKYGGAAMIGVTLLWALAHRRRLIPRDRLLLLLGLLTVLVWISAFRLWGQVPLTVPLAYASFLGLCWMVSTISDRPAVARRMVDAMLLSGAALALIGLYQYRYPFVWVVSASRIAAESDLFTGSLLDSLTWGGNFRIESLAGTPDYLGMSMQILLPFAALWTARRTTLLGRAAGVALALLLVAAMMLSTTRGVFLTTVVIVVPMLAATFGWRRSLPYLVAGALLTSAVVLGYPSFRARAEALVAELTSGDVNGAVGWRVAVLPIAWQMFMDHFWFGAGLWQQRSLWRHYAPSYLFVPGLEAQLPLHNAYLLMAIDLGVVGLTLLLLLIWFGWRRLRALRATFLAGGQGGLAALARGAEIAWVAMAANNLMYPALESFRYFWVLLAVIIGLSRIDADQRAGLAPREVDHA
jgi:O-antigen ligase